jgi:hypothetical protein
MYSVCFVVNYLRKILWDDCELFYKFVLVHVIRGLNCVF